MRFGDRSEWNGAFSSDYDYLTKVLSKAEFEVRARQLLTQAPDSRYLLVLINIDGFREINAKYGYVQGDAVLLAIARRINEVCAEGIVGRVAGDVFTVLFRGVSTYRRAEELLCELNSKVRTPQDGISVTCTIGGVWFPDEGRDYETLGLRVSERLAQAKSMGSNRFKLSRPGK